MRMMVQGRVMQARFIEIYHISAKKSDSFLTVVFTIITKYMAYGTQRFNVALQGLSNNPHAETNQPNSLY